MEVPFVRIRIFTVGWRLLGFRLPEEDGSMWLAVAGRRAASAVGL
jgi:hypothetical protein